MHKGCEILPRKPGEQELRAYRAVTNKKAYKQYDYFKRDKNLASMYNSTLWRATRKAYITAHPICEQCIKRGLTVKAREVHHVVPIADGGSLTDMSNLMSLCHECHMAIHGIQKHDNKVNIVYGAPCSGKTSYVSLNASKYDLVWDMDEVIKAITLINPHVEAQTEHITMALAMREAFFETILNGGVKDTQVWIIITDPTKLRNKFLNANYLMLDTTKEICLKRATHEGRAESAIESIHRWFDMQIFTYGDKLVSNGQG